MWRFSATFGLNGSVSSIKGQQYLVDLFGEKMTSRRPKCERVGLVFEGLRINDHNLVLAFQNFSRDPKEETKRDIL